MARLSAGKVVVIVIGAIVALVVALWVFGGSLVVSMSFDARGVTAIQLNGGTLTLANDGDGRLHARVPLRAIPVLMARRTDDLLEIGGFDDSDLRVLIYPLLQASTVPATADDVEWELAPDSLETVTIAGGTLRGQGYIRERLVLFGVSGITELTDLDIGTLAVHLQDPAEITLAGHADVYSSMETAGGTLDASELDYDEFDRGVIEGIVTAP